MNSLNLGINILGGLRQKLLKYQCNPVITKDSYSQSNCIQAFRTEEEKGEQKRDMIIVVICTRKSEKFL